MRIPTLANRRFVLKGAALFVVVVLAVSQRTAAQAPMGTAFTYQGELSNGGVPVDEPLDGCDFEFSLWSAAVDGNQVGPTLTPNALVNDGRFTVALDFGDNIFTGVARFLEIAVCCPSPCEGLTTLSPRQELTPAPYSMRAGSGVGGPDALNVDAAGNIGIGKSDPGEALDVLGNIKADGTITSGSSITIDGTAGSEKIISSDDLELHVNSGRVLRVESAEPDANNRTGVNVIGGAAVNSVSSGVVGATIAGGGGDDLDPDEGPYPNRVTARWGSIGGGMSNTASILSTVGGGESNTASGGLSTVGGGGGNTASGPFCTVSGGESNTASANVSTVGGGDSNTASASGSTVSGGESNTASGFRSTIGGGEDNAAEGQHSIIGGGLANTASGDRSTVGGGQTNIANADDSTIGGGSDNTVSGSGSTIGGGGSNAAIEHGSTIGGGLFNVASGAHSTLGGGEENTAEGEYSTIGGGEFITASGLHATVGGGWANGATGDRSTVGGGAGSVASSPFSTVCGGGGNSADGEFSAVGGGEANAASNDHSTVGGGDGNTASEQWSTVGGGQDNTASGRDSTVGGGWANTASDDSSTVGGGFLNTASVDGSTVGGGENNTAGQSQATVCGGAYNIASGGNSTVGGGGFNTASGDISSVAGGQNNTASGIVSSVGGGDSNTASGLLSTVPGGLLCEAGGDFSFAAGRRAKIRDDDPASPYYSGDIDGDEGSFVWADSTNEDFVSTGPDQFLIRASGGVGIGTSSPDHPLEMASGAHVTDGGVWTNASSRHLKENIKPVDPFSVLARVADLPVSSWNYKNEHASIRHVGPVAEDFHAAFGLGCDDASIGTIDADGVALAAIQGLHEIVKEKDAEIQVLQARLARLEAVVSELATKLSPTHEDEGGAQ